MAIIYHITHRNNWDEAVRNNKYEAPSLATEGFIHCSLENQIEGVLQRYYPSRDGLVKLVIETEKLTSPLQFDIAPSIQQEFPHIYGPINIDAVIDIQRIGS